VSVALREAAPADVPTILRFVRELAAYEREPDAVKASEADLQRVLFGERRYAEAIIAEADGVPLGFALFFHNFSTWEGRPGVYLEDLYVTPDARGRGVGKALLERLARITVERDCARLEWAVLDWNAPAIGFYRSLGAVAMDEWTVNRVTGEALRRLAGG
jgi:GNAT superfamily N-acetyltransferase